MGKYDDIIKLEHPVSAKHARMSLYERAAQFSPFAALTGYDAIITEEGRFTDGRIELSENRREELDLELNRLKNKPMEITYFVPDERKTGGRFVTVSGCVKKTNEIDGTITLDNNTVIGIETITDIKEREQGK